MEHGSGAVAVLKATTLTAVRTVPVTGSTNADLIALARAGAPEGNWLRAERQEAGRGRQGRAWSSPPGNLYASTVVRLRPSDPPAPSLALVAAVALAEAIIVASAGALPIGRDGLIVRWPNDLLVDGAKLSGILLERTDDAVVIGFGVNVAHHPDLTDRPTTDLKAIGIATTPDALLALLTERLAAWLERWRGEGTGTVQARWLALAQPIGTALSARLPDGTMVHGVFDGLSVDGALRLGLADGTCRVIHAADLTSL